MADIERIKGNVAKMVDQGAPEADIDAYISSEGTTPEALRAGSDVSTGERALRSVNRALTLGFYDNVVAHGRTIAGQRDPGQSYSEAYRANLERERARSKASEIKSIDDVVPIAGETAGNVVTGLAMLPRKAAQTTGQALQWTLEQMAPQMTRTQVAKEGAKVGGAWGAAGGLGNTDGDVVEQLQGMGAGAAGGVLLGAGLPTAMGMVGDVVSGAQGLVNKKRAAMGEAAATKAREFDEAGVPVFSPAISNSQTVQSTAEGLSGTVSGSALRQKARVSIEAVEARAKSILDEIGATRPASDVGADVQTDFRKALVERSKPKSEVDAMDPAALQDQTGMRPGFNWDPKPPKVQPTQPAPVKPVSPDDYLRQVADDVAPVPPRPVEEVRPNRIPDAKPRPPAPVEPDADLPPEVNQRFFKASDDVAAAAREFNSTRAAIVETLDAFRDRAKAMGLTLHDSPMFGPPKIVDRFGHDYRTSREMSNDARSLAATLDDWATGTMPGLEKNLQTLQARHEEASKAFAAAQTERQMAVYRATNERQLAAEQAAREETAAARRAEAERVAKANAEARAAEDARVARETEEFRRQVVERERPRAEEMAAQRTKEAEWRAYAEAERDTRQRQTASDEEFAAEVRQRRQGPVVPDNINAQTRESYPTTFDMAYRQADLNTPTIQRNPLGSDTIPGWKNTETTKVLQSIADEAAAVGRVRRGPILDENGRVRADVLDEIGRLGGSDVRGIVARLSELRPGGAAQPRVQSIDLMKREVGRALGEARSRGDWPAGTHKPDDAFLSRLYDALAKDTDAILGTQVSGNAAIAREQRRALSDQYKEYLNDLRIPLAKVFGPEVTPAQAVDRLTMAARSRTKAKSGDAATNDIKLLTSAYRVAREKGDEDRVTAAILTRLADGGMEGFLAGYRALSPEAKFVMAQSERTKQLMTQLESLAKVGGYLERYAPSARGGEGADLSRLMTTPNVMTGLLAMLHLPSAISAVVGGEVASRMLASPKFGNWLQRVPKEAARGLMSPEWQRHILRLRGYAVEQMGLPQETWGAVVETLSPTKARAEAQAKAAPEILTTLEEPPSPAEVQAALKRGVRHFDIDLDKDGSDQAVRAIKAAGGMVTAYHVGGGGGRAWGSKGTGEQVRKYDTPAELQQLTADVRRLVGKGADAIHFDNTHRMSGKRLEAVAEAIQAGGAKVVAKNNPEKWNLVLRRRPDLKPAYAVIENAMHDKDETQEAFELFSKGVPVYIIGFENAIDGKNVTPEYAADYRAKNPWARVLTMKDERRYDSRGATDR